MLMRRFVSEYDLQKFYFHTLACVRARKRECVCTPMCGQWLNAIVVACVYMTDIFIIFAL
mgnify:CR=1 FL=1